MWCKFRSNPMMSVQCSSHIEQQQVGHAGRGMCCADTAGSNTQGTTGTGLSARKLDDETEDFNSAGLLHTA